MDYLIEFVFDLGLVISLECKYHLIKFPLIDFLERQGKPLEIFSEQTSESVHKNIDKTWKRFSVSNRNSGHGEKVRKMAVTSKRDIFFCSVSVAK
jgi:hypothetical protein